MYNFNSSKKKRWIGIIGIILVAALLITTVVSGLFLS